MRTTKPFGTWRRASKRAGMPGTRLSVELLEDRSMLSVAVSGLSTAAELVRGANATSLAAHTDPSSIVVRFRQELPGLTGATFLGGTQIAADRVELVPGLRKVNLAPGIRVEDALAAYQANPLVLYAVPNDFVSPARVPNDPLYPPDGPFGDAMYGLRKIGMESAWDVTTGTTALPIADIDTGADYDHPDLYLNVWINQAEIPPSRLANLTDVDGDGLITFYDLNYQDPNTGEYINQGPGKVMDLRGKGYVSASDILADMVLDENGNDTGLGGWAYPGNTQDGDTQHPNDFIGWNFLGNNNNPFDAGTSAGHGTHTFGTLGAVGNNTVGVVGVNWTAQIGIIKAIGNGTWFQAAQAVNYAVRHGFPLSSNSWGGQDTPQAVRPLLDALAAAHDAGHLFVTAAGNHFGGLNIDISPFYPASFATQLDNIIGVASTDRNDLRASDSNYGPNSVHLGAPGVGVLSAGLSGSYRIDSGTSMATPHVAGVAALVWELNPDWTYDQVKSQILNTVDPDSSLDGITVTGGRLNAAAAVGAAPPQRGRPLAPRGLRGREIAAAFSQPAVDALTLFPVTLAGVRNQGIVKEEQDLWLTPDPWLLTPGGVNPLFAASRTEDLGQILTKAKFAMGDPVGDWLTEWRMPSGTL